MTVRRTKAERATVNVVRWRRRSRRTRPREQSPGRCRCDSRPAWHAWSCRGDSISTKLTPCRWIERAVGRNTSTRPRRGGPSLASGATFSPARLPSVADPHRDVRRDVVAPSRVDRPAGNLDWCGRAVPAATRGREQSPGGRRSGGTNDRTRCGPWQIFVASLIPDNSGCRHEDRLPGMWGLRSAAENCANLAPASTQ